MSTDRKIALCISGQMRTYKECYANLVENIIKPLNPDIFIHTWRNTGVTTKIIDRAQVNQEIVTEETLKKLYDPVSFKIEEFREEYFEELEGVKAPEELKNLGDKNWKGNIPMFYKMKKCNELKSKYEEDNDFNYDIVIKLRPDMNIREPIPEKVLNQPEFLWQPDNVHLGTQVCDRFALSNSENMDYYTSVWNKLNSYWENPAGDGKPKNYRIGERLLYHHMNKSDIEVKPFRISCEILRSRAYELENFDVIDYYMRKLYRMIR